MILKLQENPGQEDCLYQPMEFLGKSGFTVNKDIAAINELIHKNAE